MNKLHIQITHSGRRTVLPGWEGKVSSPADSRLYFVLKGGFSLTAPTGTQTQLTQGHCYLVPSGYSFCYRSDTGMDHVFFHLVLTGFDGLDLLRQVPHPLCGPLGKIPPKVLCFQDPVDSLNTESFLTGTLHTLLKENRIPLNTKRYSREVTRVMEYVQGNLSLQLRLTDLARIAFIAPSTLTRKFREETGMSPGEYLDRLIFQEAKRLLKSTDMSTREISERLGFCDPFYFSRRFREKHKIPPLQYRHTHGEL